MIQIQAGASIIVLVAMACVSVIVSMVFDRKTRALTKLSEKINVKVFDRTFSVFNPYPAARNTINSFIIWPIGLMLVFASFALAFSGMFEMGLALGLIILILCISLMMIDDIIEINATADLFMKALRSQADFGKGDVAAVHLLKQTMPRLKKYYIALATLFIISAISLPYIVQAVVTSYTQAVGSMITTTSTLGIISPLISLLVFSIVVTVILITASRLKARVFDFGTSPTLTSIEE